MALVNLSAVLQPALSQGSAVAGVVVLGWEDASAYAQAAEAEGLPLILQAGPGCRAHTPLPVLAKMFHHLAEQASVPIVAHLDHSTSLEECRVAISEGFTSVMYDGSRKPLADNIRETRAVVEIAARHGVCVEGEVGFVGYADASAGGGEVSGEASARTDPKEVEQFVAETGVQAVAVSVGNVHLQQSQAAEIDRAALSAIEAVVNIPLVIHGGSGVPSAVRADLAKASKICKFNIGTELRMAFGASLRTVLQADPKVFDRNTILKGTIPDMIVATRPILRNLNL